MKKVIFFIVILLLAVSIKGCEPDNETADNSSTSDTYYSIDCPSSNRVGAVCNDGTTSTATGSGACSHHGGVKYWICR